MTWRDRLRPEITLTSPTGLLFIAFWIGNERTLEKKLGIFEYPKVQGAVVQDLDVGGARYPLTFYFEGANHDIDAGWFFDACKERGTWKVVHPVRGELTLQLMTVSEVIQPITSGNITELKTEWIEPIVDNILSSVVELEADIESKAKDLQNSSKDQFRAIVELDKPSKITQLKTSIDKAVAKIDAVLIPLTKQSAEINAIFLSVKRGISQGLDDDPLDVLSLAGQLSALVTIPSGVLGFIETVDSVIATGARLNTYKALIETIIEDSVGAATSVNINSVAVQELVLVSAVSAVNQIAIDGDLESREQAVEIIESIGTSFIDVTDALDQTQDLYKDNAIDDQYFSQSQSFNSAAILTGQTTTVLLRKSFDLAVAKRFILSSNRAPVEISATEYQSLDRLDFFISSNKLKGDDILLLPAGREVVVYL